MNKTRNHRQEEARQAQILADAIDKTIRETAEQFETPMMNAVAGALVTVQGHMLASVPTEHRKAMRKAMEKRLPAAIAQAKPKSIACKTITLSDKPH